MKGIKQKIWHFLLSSPGSLFSRKVAYLAAEVDELRWQQRLQPAQTTSRNDIPTYTSEAELRALYTLASCCPENSNALEIGSYLGASSCYIAAGLSTVDGHLFCVDTWQNEAMIEEKRDTYSQFLKNTAGVRRWITPVRKRSSQLENSDIPHPLSLVFIDGDHRFEAAKLDFEIAQQWLAHDGIVAFHDFSNPEYDGVSRVVGEALASGDWMLVGKVGTLAWMQRSQWRQPHWLHPE